VDSVACLLFSVVALAAQPANAANTTAPTSPPRIVDAPVREGDFTGWVDSTRLTEQSFDRLPGVTVRQIESDASTGRLVVIGSFPPGYRLQTRPRFAQSLDLIVLEGTLRVAAHELTAKDFAFIPPDTAIPMIASARGARALLFFDPPSAVAEQQRLGGIQVTRFAQAPWIRSTIVGDAGVDVPLMLKFLKRDALSGARTWYVQLQAGKELPWERHSVAEQGFLVEGDYFLNECLPGGTLSGAYQPGGYFHRPPGILHSGPGSGTRSGAIWLQRSGAALDVQFFSRCEGGIPSGPVGPGKPAQSNVPAAPK